MTIFENFFGFVRHEGLRGCLVFTLDRLFISHNMELNRNWNFVISSQQFNVSALLIRREGEENK